MRDSQGGFLLGYTAEVAVTEDHFIAAVNVSQSKSDNHALVPMVEQLEQHYQQPPESVLADTGIRKLRKEPVFTSPNVQPPAGFVQKELNGDADFREVVEPQNCYICKKDYSKIHHFYDQLCPACAELNFRKRTELADLRGASADGAEHGQFAGALRDQGRERQKNSRDGDDDRDREQNVGHHECLVEDFENAPPQRLIRIDDELAFLAEGRAKSCA